MLFVFLPESSAVPDSSEPGAADPGLGQGSHTASTDTDAARTDADALTLAELLDYADENAPAIHTAQARAGIAGAQMAEASIALPENPELRFSGGVRSVAGNSRFEFGVAVRQQLEVAGQRGRRMDAAEEAQREADSIVDEVRWAVHVETHRLFVDLILVDERIEQAERFVAFSTFLRDVAQRQIDAGESSPLILLVADADLAETREALLIAEQAREALELRLAAVVGWPEDTLPALDGSLPAIQAAPEAETLLALMTEHHPTLRRRTLAVEARRSQLEAARRDAAPNPSIGLAYNREANPGPGEDADIYRVEVGIPIPIARRNQGDRAHAEAMLEVADQERAAEARRLRSELHEAASALDAAAARVRLYETDVMPQLERNLSLLRRAYELGEVDILQVSQTRERLLDATAQYLDARIYYYETLARLEGLVGTDIAHATESSP